MSKRTVRPHRDMHYLNMGPWPVYVGFTTSQVAFDCELKRLGVKDSVEFVLSNAGAMTHSFNNSDMLLAIITIPFTRKRSVEQIAALIAHEALHAVQYMRERLNQDRPFDNETESYLVQYITLSCTAIYRKSPRTSRAISP